MCLQPSVTNSFATFLWVRSMVYNLLSLFQTYNNLILWSLSPVVSLVIKVGVFYHVLFHSSFTRPCLGIYRISSQIYTVSLILSEEMSDHEPDMKKLKFLKCCSVEDLECTLCCRLVTIASKLILKILTKLI